MQSMTIEQLRAASDAGGVEGVTLKGQGGTFLVQIATRSGAAAVLAKARSQEPRRFGNPIAALNVLRGVGITIGQFDASEWNPDEKEETAGNRGRAEAMRKAHQAAAYSEWLAAEIQDAIDDPRPNLSHDEVMAEMDADIAALAAEHKRA
ncbi:antitoxin PaaA2 family protein [Photorhabdus laumondii]